jgi:hypothetical protein
LRTDQAVGWAIRKAWWRRRQMTGEKSPMFGMKRREFITLLGGAGSAVF